MPLFKSALEADKLLRIDFMIKDDKKFNNNGDHWGYARVVKKDGKFESRSKGPQDCISCHSEAKGSDYLFTHMQSTF